MRSTLCLPFFKTTTLQPMIEGRQELAVAEDRLKLGITEDVGPFIKITKGAALASIDLFASRRKPVFGARGKEATFHK